jgi:hypothetical protein
VSDEDASVDISGLDKAAVLAVLYNAAAPHRMGFLQTEHAPEVMTIEEARQVIEVRGHDHMALFRSIGLARQGPVLSFSYVFGRPLKANIAGDSLRTASYDRYHGEGAAASAIAELRRTGEVCSETVYAAHVCRLREQVRDVLENSEQYAALERETGLGDHAARMTALARKALGADA